MYVFDVIFVHDFLLNDGRVLALLGEARVHEQQLRREDDLQEEALEDGNARARVESRQREEEHMDEDMARAEEAEHAQRCRVRIPHLHLPHVARPVWVCSLVGGLGPQDLLNESQGRGGRRGRIDADTGRRGRSRPRLFDVPLKKPVMAGSCHGGEGVESGDGDEHPLEGVGLFRVPSI